MHNTCSVVDTAYDFIKGRNPIQSQSQGYRGEAVTFFQMVL